MEGELGELFGKERTIFAESFADVFHCLNANFEGKFQQYIVDCHEKDLGFILHVDGNYVGSEEELFLAHPPGTMTISPAPVGSGGKIGGFLKIIAAIVIAVVLVTVFGPAGAGFAEAFAGLLFGAEGFLVAAAAFAAVGLALSGMMQLLAPDPATDSQQEEDYIFQGAEQNIVEGDPVPVCYGKLRVPGRPIGFDIRNKYQSYVNYNRRAGFSSAVDTSSNFFDYGNLAQGGGTSNAIGADIRAYYGNIEIQNRNYTGGGRVVDNNPNTVLR